MSEADYNSLLETVYLMSHPATRDTILEGMKEPLEDCVPLDEAGLVMYQIYFTKAGAEN